MKNIAKYLFILIAAFGSSCTNLEEIPYSTILTTNFIQSKKDVISLVSRPMGHAAWACANLTELQELPADHWVTYTVNNQYWGAGGYYARIHKHQWVWDDAVVEGGWTNLWGGAMQCTNVIDILEDLENPGQYGITAEEMTDWTLQMRVTRAWFYLRLFDLYRNLPLVKSIKYTDRNSEGQVPAQTMFEFIESELKGAVEALVQKESLGGNGSRKQLWNKAGAASLLVRLYLNSEKWTGTARYDLCAQYAQQIIDGDYGPYALDDVWDEPFKWNNDTSDEIIYAFDSNKAYAHNHYGGDHFGFQFPIGEVWTRYFLFSEYGNPNFRFGMSPGLDVDYVEYSYKQGKPYIKFKKYPADYRLKMYKNLGGGEREGMWLFGYIPDLLTGGGAVCKQMNGDDLYLRDQAGFFGNAGPTEIIADKRSGVEFADDNSGLRFVKYPYYPDSDSHLIYEADYAEIRLAEIYYSLAECKLRDGDALSAGNLLNQVRKRNYPESEWASSLYKSNGTPDVGTVELDMQELLDEWGREFIGEQRRRTDLIRFNKFTEAWWDKDETDAQKEIFPIPKTALATNPKLKQNPGYASY